MRFRKRGSPYFFSPAEAQLAESRTSRYREELDRSGLPPHLWTFFRFDVFHDGAATILQRRRPTELALTLDCPNFRRLGRAHPSGFTYFSIGFRVVFTGVSKTCLRVEEASAASGLDLLGTEINTLTRDIQASARSHGGQFHSLLIQFSGAWMSIVFRDVAVRVIPSDAVRLVRALRSTKVMSPCGVGREILALMDS